MPRSARVRRLAPVLAVVLVLGACSDDEGPDGAGPTPTGTADATATATPEVGSEATANEPDGTLRLGYILPETGPLSLLGPPQISAIGLALEEINGAGGVLGQPVTISAGDEAGDPTVSAQTAQRLLGEGVDAIIGAASSGMSLAIVDAVTEAGVAQCSASNTSATFTEYDDDGLYFRTAPTDAIQGRVLAEAIVRDGHANVAFMARADDYGQGLMNATRTALERRDASVVASIVYDPEAASFDDEVQQVANAGADAIVLIGYDEAAEILTGMIEVGVGPADVAVYGGDGLRSNDLAGLVDPNDPSVLEGVRGTAPSGGTSDDFLRRFQEASGLDDTTYAAQAYDCTILLALAAVAAGSDAGVDLAAQVVAVSRGGTKCLSFKECRDLLEAGEDVDYDGASGSVDLVAAGEPEVGTYDVWRIDAQGGIVTDTTLESTVERD